MATTKARKSPIIETLQQACARNLTADLHYDLTESHVSSARARFLRVDENRLVLDEPHLRPGATPIEKGKSLTVFFLLNRIPHAFEARVEKRRTKVAINHDQTVNGICLSVPSNIEEQQRRREYRVSVSAASLGCKCVLAGEAVAYACDLHSKPLEGVVVNLSMQGVGLRIPDKVEPPEQGRPMYVEFSLPDNPEPLMLLAEVRHVDRSQPHAVYVGLAVQPPDGGEDRRQQDRLRRFLIQQERSQLRRRK